MKKTTIIIAAILILFIVVIFSSTICYVWLGVGLKLALPALLVFVMFVVIGLVLVQLKDELGE